MAQIKPEVADREVVALVSTFFDAPVTRIDTPQTGQIARTFFCTVNGREYVVRFNRDNMGANLPKEAYIYAHYASPRIPIPEILHVGRHSGLHYAISRRVPGAPLVALPYAAYRRMIPAFLDTLDAIHAAEVTDTRGYGTFDNEGIGLFTSWRESLAVIREEEAPGSFYEAWHHLFEDSILERDVFDTVYARMIDLLAYCPEERYLVHGGPDLSNVVGHEGRITGVLDWINAMYGDFVYDFAGLDFWTPGEGYAALCRSRYRARAEIPPAYDERMLCYGFYHGLSALRFFAHAGDLSGYQWARDRIEGLGVRY